MGGIFLNYRQSPERQPRVRTLRDRLAERFGEGQVFLDEPSIEPGKDYRDELTRRLLDAEVVIAIIHPTWVADLRENGTDWVRKELKLALDNDKTIIPVLVDGADILRADALPEPIRPIAYLQVYRLHDRTWAAGRSLIEALDHDVAREWKPGEPDNVAPTPQRGWSRFLAPVLGVAALVAPVPLLPDDLGVRELAIYASVFALAILLASMIALLVTFLARKSINFVEHSVQDMPLWAYYLRVAAPVALLFLLFLGSGFFGGLPPAGAVPMLFFFAIVITLYVIVWIRRQHRDAEKRDNEWPQRLPEPVRAAPARQELARLDRRVNGWPKYRATRELRDRAEWHIGHLRSAAEALCVDAHRSRWNWLTADHPVLFGGYALWTSGSVGLLIAVALPRLVLWIPATAAVFAGLTAGGTAEFGYRRQRWVRTEVAKEIRERAADIERSLTELSGRRN